MLLCWLGGTHTTLSSFKHAVPKIVETYWFLDFASTRSNDFFFPAPARVQRENRRGERAPQNSAGDCGTGASIREIDPFQAKCFSGGCFTSPITPALVPPSHQSSATVNCEIKHQVKCPLPLPKTDVNELWAYEWIFLRVGLIKKKVLIMLTITSLLFPLSHTHRSYGGVSVASCLITGNNNKVRTGEADLAAC